MDWQRKTLVFQLNSGLCIGSGTLGFIKHTRWFVPSKILWAMTTKAVTESVCKPLEAKQYQEVGNAMDASIKFTNFYLLTRENGDIWYRPEFTKNGLLWGKLKGYEFAQKFLATYTSTALTIESTSAEEDTLHEIEYLLPRYRSNGQGSGNVYLAGQMFYRSEEGIVAGGKKISVGEILQSFQNANLYMGGESAYGYGQVKYLSDCNCSLNFDSIQKVEDGQPGRPICTFTANNPLPSFLKVVPQGNTRLSGETELLVGREWAFQRNSGKEGAGQKITSRGFCWSPGTIVNPMCLCSAQVRGKERSKQKIVTSFIIREQGIWEQADGKDFGTS